MDDALSSGHVTVAELQSWAQPYMALTDAMIYTLADLLDEIKEDATAYVTDAQSNLPTWLRAEQSSL